MNLASRLVYWRSLPLIGRLVQAVLRIQGLEIPNSVRVGADLTVAHRGMGTVVHPNTEFGNRVRLYHNVTIGRRSAYRSGSVGRIYVGDDVMLFPGSVVLCDEGTLRVGTGTVLAANSVLTTDTGEWEIWGGSPARRIAARPVEGAATVAQLPTPRIVAENDS